MSSPHRKIFERALFFSQVFVSPRFLWTNATCIVLQKLLPIELSFDDNQALKLEIHGES